MQNSKRHISINCYHTVKMWTINVLGLA